MCWHLVFYEGENWKYASLHCILGAFFSANATVFVLSYSKICLKRPLKNRQNKGLKTNGSLMKEEIIAECSLGAFCNTFDLH